RSNRFGGPGALGADGQGGGAFVTAVSVSFIQTTLAGNVAQGGNGGSGGIGRFGGAHGVAGHGLGGGVYNAGLAALNNTLIAGSPSGGDVYSPGHLDGHSSLIQDPSNQPLVDGVDGNIVGHDPLLGALTMHGGPRATIPLLAGSPAIDAGDPSLA